MIFYEGCTSFQQVLSAQMWCEKWCDNAVLSFAVQDLLQIEIETHFGRSLSSWVWVLQIVLKWYEVSKVLGICQQFSLKENSNYSQSMLGSSQHEAMGHGAFPSSFCVWSSWIDRHLRGKISNKENQRKKIIYLPAFENCD